MARRRASRSSRDGRSWPFTTPLDLLRFQPLPLRVARADGPAPCCALQRPATDVAPFESETARDWIDAAMGRRRGTRSGARCCAASSASAPTTSRWRGCGASCGCAASQGRGARQERLGYPRGSLGDPVRALREADRVARRPRADRPPGARVCAPRRPASRSARRAGSFRRGHDPRGVRRRPAGRAPTTRVLATVPERRLRAAARPGAGRRGRRRLPRAAATRSSTTPRSACCSSSTGSSRPFYWTNVADRGCRSSG